MNDATPEPADYVSLYRRAFSEYGTQALEAAGFGVRWIRRSPTIYAAAEWRALVSAEPIDPKVVIPKLRAALEDAEAFVTRMPTDKVGLLFLKGGHVVQPDPDRLDEYQTHAGKNRGHWPGSLEITAAMFERYSQKPNGDQW